MSEQRESEGENLPAICGDVEVARLLGIHVDWVEFLEGKGHLRSLGGRTKGCQRYYASGYVRGLRGNEEWLDKAVRLVRLHFRNKNARRQS